MLVYKRHNCLVSQWSTHISMQHMDYIAMRSYSSLLPQTLTVL